MKIRQRLRRLHIIGGTAVFVIALIANTLVLVMPAATADAEDTRPLPDPVVPSESCEWYGEMSWERTIKVDSDIYDHHQTQYDAMDVSSAAVDGESCGMRWSARSQMDYVDRDIDACAFGATKVRTYTKTTDYVGSGNGHYSAGISGPLGTGEYYPSLFGYAHQSFYGREVSSVVGGCSADDLHTDEMKETGPWSINAGCWGGFDQGGFFVNPNAQAMAGTCSYNTSDTNSSGTLQSSDETYTWRLRRVNCNAAIDTDRGGVSDCQEYNNNSNPALPGDDNHSNPGTDTDGDGRSDSEEGKSGENSGTDTDGDGIPDFKDSDSDNDGKPDQEEGDGDTDQDGTPDWRDSDGDNDSVPDTQDNCPTVPSLDQSDQDGDGVGDACESGSGSSPDTLKIPTSIHEVMLDVGANDLSVERITNVYPSSNLPGTLHIEGTKIRWDLPDRATPSSPPLLGIFQFAYATEATNGDRDTSSVNVTLYDCTPMSAQVRRGDSSLNWEPTFCFDKTNVWFENLEAGEQDGIREETAGGPVGGFFGLTYHWTQGPATVFGYRTPVVTQADSNGFYHIEGTSQLCFQATGPIEFLVKKVVKSALKQLFVQLGIDAAAADRNDLIDAIMGTGKGCLDREQARMDWQFRADGSYYLRAKIEGPVKGQNIDETFWAAHQRQPSLSGGANSVAGAEVSRSRKGFIDAIWSCNVYDTTCRPTVKPRP